MRRRCDRALAMGSAKKTCGTTAATRMKLCFITSMNAPCVVLFFICPSWQNQAIWILSSLLYVKLRILFPATKNLVARIRGDALFLAAHHRIVSTCRLRSWSCYTRILVYRTQPLLGPPWL